MLTAGVKFKPHLISWNITKRCNLKCPHCYIDASNLESEKEGELTTEEGLTLIDQIAQLNRDTMLILTGGEPLLRRDVLKLAGAASQKGLMVVLGTNGILIDEKLAGEMVENGVAAVGISLDSVRPEAHDSFRGLKGGWELALRGIEACKKAGLPFQIQSTVTQSNYDEVPALVEFSYCLGAKAFVLFFLVCTGRGENLTDITPVQYEKMLSYILDVQEKYGGMRIRPRCAPHFARIVYERSPDSQLLGQLLAGCPAGRNYCRVAPNGEVTPCPYMPFPVGNVRKTSFVDVWNESEVLRRLRNRDNLKGRCGSCKFRELCGGCRARAYAFSSDYLAEEPWCTYTPGSEKPMGAGRSLEVSQGSRIPSLANGSPRWIPEATEAIKRIPPFVRGMVAKRVEAYAKTKGYQEITLEVLNEVKSKMRNSGFHRHG